MEYALFQYIVTSYLIQFIWWNGVSEFSFQYTKALFIYPFIGDKFDEDAIKFIASFHISPDEVWATWFNNFVMTWGSLFIKINCSVLHYSWGSCPLCPYSKCLRTVVVLLCCFGFVFCVSFLFSLLLTTCQLTEERRLAPKTQAGNYNLRQLWVYCLLSLFCYLFCSFYSDSLPLFLSEGGSMGKDMCEVDCSGTTLNSDRNSFSQSKEQITNGWGSWRVWCYQKRYECDCIFLETWKTPTLAMVSPHRISGSWGRRLWHMCGLLGWLTSRGK